MKKFFSKLMKEEKGQGMTEYGLILGLIAIVVVVALTTMGETLQAKFNDVVSKLTGAGSTTP